MRRSNGGAEQSSLARGKAATLLSSVTMTLANEESSISGDSDASSDSGVEQDNRDALAQCRQALGLSINYMRTWKPRDAFREFYQN